MVAKFWQGLIYISLFTNALSLSKHPRDISQENCIGQSTKILARAILQTSEDNQENIAFSPFGYSSIFAMIAEGSSGDTEIELSQLLHLHKESDKQRENFKEILTNIKDRYEMNRPQMRTWFYVHKNFSVEQSYKQVLLDYYLTKVKNVTPYELDSDNTKSDVTDPEVNDEANESLSLPEDKGNLAYNEKLIIRQAEEEAQKDSVRLEVTPTGSIQDQPAVQSDSIVPTADQQNNEVNVEIEKQQDDNVLPKEQILPIELDETKHDSGRVSDHAVKSNNNEETKANEEEAIREQRTGLNFDEMKFLPEIWKKGGKSLDEYNSLMIIFHGYYFEGNWSIPFERNTTMTEFHLNKTAKVEASTLKAKGKFKVADLPHLNSTAISIPYEGEQYSFIIVLPNECDGLNDLVRALDDSTYQEIIESLKEKEIEVQLPEFVLESTTDPKLGLYMLGVSSLFNEYARLDGISKTGELYPQEMVQLLTMRVDKNIGTTNFMTATSVTNRGLKDTFLVNHPFLFFVEDNKFNTTVVTGLIRNPTL